MSLTDGFGQIEINTPTGVNDFEETCKSKTSVACPIFSTSCKMHTKNQVRIVASLQEHECEVCDRRKPETAYLPEPKNLDFANLMP